MTKAYFDLNHNWIPKTHPISIALVKCLLLSAQIEEVEGENLKLREDLGRLRELVARGAQEDGQGCTKFSAFSFSFKFIYVNWK